MADADRPIALVTGGSRRVGAHIALSLHATHDLIIHTRLPNQRASAFVADLDRVRPGSVRLVAADLDDPASLERLATAVGPRLDVLIHNASRFEPCNDTFDAAWAASLTQHMRTNLAGPVVLTHHLQAALQEAARLTSGTALVVWMLDTRRSGVFPLLSAYSLSRAAGAAAVQTLAHALVPDIRVVGIAPGTVLPSERPQKAVSAAIQQSQALGAPFGATADVTAAIQFAVSAQFLNATIIELDGGKRLWPA